MRFLDDSSARPKAAPVLKAVMSPEVESVQPDKATMEAHLARSRYGRFTLTEAVRPGWQLDVVPQAGYRHDTYVDPATGARLPAVIASVSREDLFDTFLQLLEPLGDVLDVVLESSHATPQGQGHQDFTREGIERLVLESVLWDFEDLLLHDGCTGIAVMHPESSLEVQFDEHKLLVVYAPSRPPFEAILRGRGIPRDDRMRFISQGEHLHTSHAGYSRQFAELVTRLGAV